MAKKKPVITVESYGKYTRWERGSKVLPKILDFTTIIEAIEGNEFGIIISIEKGKGIKLDFSIKHPPFKDSEGNMEPDYTGEYYVNSNRYRFYIGDSIWMPVEDKLGEWEISVFTEGKKIVSKIFSVVLPPDSDKI
ncbi:MAG: DUF3859 domain-containing protein [Bacteroidales bacterium]|nr:DUF3859 domain-containing protein [Bacteroidales bacterium]